MKSPHEQHVQTRPAQEQHVDVQANASILIFSRSWPASEWHQCINLHAIVGYDLPSEAQGLLQGEM